jgi:hypothetical protein
MDVEQTGSDFRFLTHCGHWVTAREMARSILERHSGRLECREPASTSGLGF